MEKIRIITDSASDLSASTREDLTILPLAIRFGDTEYLDGVTISHHEFYEKLIESDTLPTTSLVSPPLLKRHMPGRWRTGRPSLQSRSPAVSPALTRVPRSRQKILQEKFLSSTAITPPSARAFWSSMRFC